MPVQAKADGNVPMNLPTQIGRARYSLVGVEPTLLMHYGTINGKLPAMAAVAPAVVPDPTILDPVVTSGKASWGSPALTGPPSVAAVNLAQGGLFPFAGRTLVIEALVGTGTWTLVDVNGAITRPTPTTFPFKITGGEQLSCTGGSSAGVVVRLDGQKVL